MEDLPQFVINYSSSGTFNRKYLKKVQEETKFGTMYPILGTESCMC